MAPSKRQTTFAKMTREQAVKDRRARKQQKREERKQAAAELSSGQVNAFPARGAGDDGSRS